uniref:NADH-ubiquinone oxidoreductase chain 4L n=1 Tax=Dimorphostylis asiatica TaxID=2840398 RepID=A0A8F8FG66_9CRUS|nr:NADH dehydrogenase subunit 4L [Dimorphostylis asiatica]
MLWFFLVFIVMFCSVTSFLVLVMNYEYFLTLLIALEFMVVSVIFLLVFCLSGLSYEFYIVLYVMTFTVCESALGLSVLIFMVRSRGSEYFSSMNLMSW